MIFRLGRLCHEYIAQGIMWFLAFVIVLRANGPQRFQIIFLACLGREYVQRNVACGKGKLLYKELSQDKVAQGCSPRSMAIQSRLFSPSMRGSISPLTRLILNMRRTNSAVASMWR